MSCLNQAYYRKPNGKMRTEEEVEEYMKSLPQIPPPPHNEENKDIVEIINNNQVFLKYYKEQQEEIERLNNIINELEKELDRGYRDLFEHELVPGRELITNIKNYLQELKGSDK